MPFFVTFFHPDLIDLNEWFWVKFLGAGQFHGKWVLWGRWFGFLISPQLKGIVTYLGAPPNYRAPKQPIFSWEHCTFGNLLQDSEHSFRCFDFKGELLELREELSSEEMPTGGRLWDAGILVLSFKKNMLFGYIYIYIYVNIMIMKMRFQFLRYFLCWTTSSHTLGFGTWWLLLFAVVGTVIYNFRDSNWG